MGLCGRALCPYEGGGEEWRAAAGERLKRSRYRAVFWNSAWQTIGLAAEATTAQLQLKDDEPTWHSQQQQQSGSTAQHNTAHGAAGTGSGTALSRGTLSTAGKA